MNDAEYCTDAHRQAYGEEQVLAMQRLSDSAPAMQRTQRMAAHGGPTMSVVGVLCPDAPQVKTGLVREMTAAAIPTAATVLYQDRQHSYHSGLPYCQSSMPLTLSPAQSPAPSAAVIGQDHPVRIVIPRDLVSRPYWNLRWSRVPISTLEPLPEMAPSTGGGGGQRIGHGLAPLAYRMSVQDVRRPVSGPEKSLAQVVSLTRLELAAAGRAARWRQPVAEVNSMHAVSVQFPKIQLSLILVWPSAPEVDEREELWSALEASPLGALLSATGYTDICPAAPVPAPQKARWRSLALAFPAGQTAYAAPASAIATRDLPVHKMPESVVLRPVGLSALTLVTSRAIATSHAPLAPAVDSNLPSVTVFHRAKGLPLETRVVPVAAPPAATLEATAKWNGDWQSHALQHLVCKLGKTAGPKRMPAGRIATLPRHPAVGGLDVGSARSTWANRNEWLWIVPQVNELRPSTPMPAAGGGIGMAGRVPYDWRPNAADGPHRVYPPQMLRAVLRYRMPSHALRPARGHKGAECVPIVPPAMAILRWNPMSGTAVDLCPAVQLPGPAKLGRPVELRKLPIRLFRINGAYPMARPLGGKPMAFGLDLWGGKPVIRPSGLIADDGTPRQRAQSASRFRFDWKRRLSSDSLRNAWRKASHLPSDLKWIAMVVPMVIGIWVLSRPTTAEPASVAVQATRDIAPAPVPVEKETQLAAMKPVLVSPMETERLPLEKISKSDKSPVRMLPAASSPGAWDAFTARIAHRASVDLVEDFHNGLSAWEGRGEWARSWSYDRSGTVRPGHLAIYQPTVNLRNYVMEMKASIERRSIQWVVRASGIDNYHFARLNVTPGAPLTKLELERWTVINGRMGRVTRLPLPHGGANQTVYSIRVEVQGDSITTYLQDQVIDTFNDSRLQEGGVGLVGGPDDRARIYGIRVYHQNDFLGKLCSFLAPLPINSQGSD